MLRKYKDIAPDIAESAYVDSSAQVIGKVRMAALSSLWPGVVARGDIEEISIGKRTNVQDNSIMHTHHGMPLVLEDNITVGHGVILHSCHVERGALIGIGSILLNGVRIGQDSQVAAGSVCPPGKVYPPRSLILGTPARVVRELTDEEIAANHANTEDYIRLLRDYAEADKSLF